MFLSINLTLETKAQTGEADESSQSESGILIQLPEPAETSLPDESIEADIEE